MSRKVIAVDLDDTVSYFVESWLYHYNIAGYDNVMKCDIADWDITRYVKKENQNMIMNMLRLWTIYTDAKIREDAKETMYYMQDKADVFIVTAPGTNYSICQAKYEWVLDNLPEFDAKHLVFLNQKELFNAQFLIDDKAETCRKFRSNGGQAYLFNEPWNRNDTDLTNRFDNWKEIRTFMESYL